MSSARVADRARITEIEGEIAEIGGEIESVSERLAHLRLSVQTLRSEEANIRERLSSYDDPASILPAEIVSEIFVHVLPAYPICPPLAGKYSPTQLTHICRQWREIAMSTPLLWRAIRIPFLHDESRASDLVFFVETWLCRSGSCPLSIDIKEPIGLERTFLEGVIGAIVPHPMRWQYLSLSLSESGWCDELLELIQPVPMPLLYEMKLRFDGSGWDPETMPPSLPTAFREAPGLRSMTLENFTFPSIGFPWWQLTSLGLEGIVLSDCTKVLRQTVNLVHCKLSPDGESSIDSQPDTRLPRLESLELVQYVYGDELPLAEYLGTFNAPALLRLELEVPEYEFNRHRAFHSLSVFIAKTGCNLQELRIISPSDCPSRQLADYRRELAYIPRVFYNNISLDEECETSSSDSEDEEWDETSDESSENRNFRKLLLSVSVDGGAAPPSTSAGAGL
ncbi:hypothetical protein GGX14DRAFT_571721 [Mycena pura]|uniref:F-box domain-containing protein n=1 Tax=Mycena pura TaxID=153505 RepID=A0AAD6V2M0_9AGAR|nr:hypothetical protein GGX14DRAFT_571721 [Mycena pura]